MANVLAGYAPPAYALMRIIVGLLSSLRTLFVRVSIARKAVALS